MKCDYIFWKFNHIIMRFDKICQIMALDYNMHPSKSKTITFTRFCIFDTQNYSKILIRVIIDELTNASVVNEFK